MNPHQHIPSSSKEDEGNYKDENENENENENEDENEDENENENENEPIQEYLTRTYSIHQKPVKNGYKDLVFKYISSKSKLIKNQTIFLIRQFGRTQQTQIEYISNHLDVFSDKLTSQDRLKLAKYLSYSKQEAKLEQVIGLSHPCEELNLQVNRKYKTLSDTEPNPLKCSKSTLDDIITLYQDIIDETIPQQQYEDDFIMEFCSNMIIIIRKEQQNKQNSIQKKDELEEYKKEHPEEFVNKPKKPKKVRKTAKKSKPLQQTKKKAAISSESKKEQIQKPMQKNIIIESMPSNSILDMYIKQFCDYGSHIGSQCVQQTIKKVYESYKSFFALIKTEQKPSIPRYSRDDYHNIVFQNNSFKIIDRGAENRLAKQKLYNTKPKKRRKNPKKPRRPRIKRDTRLRLSLGKEFNANFDFGKIKNYDEKTKMVNGKQLDEKYIYIKIKRCLKKREITEVELKPIHKGTAFKICLKYNINACNLILFIVIFVPPKNYYNLIGSL